VEEDSKPRVVNAADADGPVMSLMQLFGLGPRWTIRCGHCGNTFSERLPMIDFPTIPCPLCKTLNRIQVVTETG